MRGIGLAMLLVVVVVVVACAPPVAQDSPELAARDEDWELAFNGGDLATLTAIYADDARVLPPNDELAQGQAAIEAAFAELVEGGFKLSLDPIEAQAAGDTGYSVGRWEMTDASGEVLDRGKYIETFRNVGGEWRITNDIWNSDMPAGPEGEQVVVVHKVKDDAKWIAAWQAEPGRRASFAEHGAPAVTIFGSPENPKTHAVLVQVTDMDAFTTWLNSPEGRAAKAEDGVIDQGFMVFTAIP